MLFGGQTLPQIIDDIGIGPHPYFDCLLACSIGLSNGKNHPFEWCIYEEKNFPFANKIYNLAIAFQ